MPVEERRLRLPKLMGQLPKKPEREPEVPKDKSKSAGPSNSSDNLLIGKCHNQKQALLQCLTKVQLRLRRFQLNPDNAEPPKEVRPPAPPSEEVKSRDSLLDTNQ